MSLNLPHLHLLLNHVPTVGSVVGIGLLILALVRRNSQLLRASLEVLFLIAVATVPVYLTGVTAEQAISKMDGVSTAAITTHETAAITAFLWMQLVGLVAWIGIWQNRRLQHIPTSTVVAVVGLSVVTVALMGQAASIGGEIRHPEIIVEGQTPAAEAGTWGMLTGAQIESTVKQIPWVWPALETLHFLGLCLSLGVLIAMTLRVLGVMKGMSFAAMHRFLPWGILGFALNLVTGMGFFVAASNQYTENMAFYWKVVALVVAGGHFLYMTVVDRLWALQAGQDASGIDRTIAVLGLASWVGIIFWGRMLPFLGNAF